MKKLAIIVISIVFCLPFLSKAQDAPATDTFKPFSFGLKAIPSISFLKSNVNDFKNTKPKANFGYGLIAEFNFAPNYGFFTGIEINDNGGNIDYLSDSIFYKPEGDTNRFYINSRKFAIKYLNIPLLLKLKTNEIGFLKYYGQFGIDAGFRLKATANDNGQYVATSASDKTNVNIEQDINLIRLALNIGMGAEYNLSGSTSMVFGLNYSNAFTNFLRKESKDLYKVTNNTPDLLKQNAYNSYVALTVGILF